MTFSIHHQRRSRRNPGRASLRLGIILVFMGGVFAARLHGDTVLVEPFAHPDGFLEELSLGKWTGHSGTALQVDVLGERLQLTSAESQDVNARLAGEPFTAAGTPALYARFKVRFSRLPAAAGGYFAHFNSGTFRGRVWALASPVAPEAFRLGLSSISGTAPTTVDERELVLETDYLVVLRLSLADGFARLWIDPAAESDPSISSDAGTAVTVNSFAFRQAPGIGTLSVDDLVVATTFEDVIQEAAGIRTAPRITTQPVSVNAVRGDPVAFMVNVTGTPPPTFAWLFNNLPVPGETNSVLSLFGVTSAQAGEYRVVVTNPLGSVTSAPALLTVTEPPVIFPMPPLVAFTNELSNLVRPGDGITSTNRGEYVLRPTETLTIKVRLEDNLQKPLLVRPLGERLPSGTAWKLTQPVPFLVMAELVFTADEPLGGQSFFAQLEAINDQGTNRVQWRLYVPLASEAGVVINEFLANPTDNPAAPHYNPLQRQTPSASNRIGTEDEYVELINLGSGVVDLQGWTFSDAVAVRHTFGPFDFLPPSGSFVLYGGRLSGSVPRLDRRIPAAFANGGSSGLALNNNGDDLVLRNARGQMVARVVYSAALVNAGGSVTRVPDGTGEFMPHSGSTGLSVTPGRSVTGGFFPGTESPGPLPLKLVAAINGFMIQLRWNADTNLTYTVLSASTPEGPYTPAATGLAASEFTDASAPVTPQRFFRIQTP